MTYEALIVKRLKDLVPELVSKACNIFYLLKVTFTTDHIKSNHVQSHWITSDQIQSHLITHDHI